MNTTARTILSIAAFLGVVAFTAVNFALHGIAAPATVLGIAALAIYGTFATATLSYAPAPRRRVAMPREPRPAVVRPRHRTVRRVAVPAVVEFGAGSRKAA